MENKRTLKNRFTEAYKTRHPFVNAAMAFVGSTASLPTAAINAGAMGTLAVGVLTPQGVSREVEQIRQNSNPGPLNINLIAPFVSEEHIDLLCELKPEVVSFHWGPIKQHWIDNLHAVGIRVWEQIGSADAAKRAIDAGVDALVAQGAEAGGHNLSTLPTFVLLPEVRRAAGSSMIIAGGGISNGQQVAAALALGADAVWVGSRFIASLESDAHSAYKQQVMETQTGSATVLTHILGREIPDFNPLRILSNKTTDTWHDRVDEVDKSCPEREILGHTKINGHSVPVDQFASFPPTTETTGDIASMAFSCGQGVGSITTIDSVENIIATMMDEACDILNNLEQSMCSYEFSAV